MQGVNKSPAISEPLSAGHLEAAAGGVPPEPRLASAKAQECESCLLGQPWTDL